MKKNADVIQLTTVNEAAKRLRMSRGYLYALPPGTPGILKLGRSTRIDLQRFIAALQERRR